MDENFPDEDDFGRIFRNNAVLSALGVPQILWWVVAGIGVGSGVFSSEQLVE